MLVDLSALGAIELEVERQFRLPCITNDSSRLNMLADGLLRPQATIVLSIHPEACFQLASIAL
jgi:hypothetical protein